MDDVCSWRGGQHSLAPAVCTPVFPVLPILSSHVRSPHMSRTLSWLQFHKYVSTLCPHSLQHWNQNAGSNWRVSWAKAKTSLSSQTCLISCCQWVPHLMSYPRQGMQLQVQQRVGQMLQKYLAQVLLVPISLLYLKGRRSVPELTRSCLRAFNNCLCCETIDCSTLTGRAALPPRVCQIWRYPASGRCVLQPAVHCEQHGCSV